MSWLIACAALPAFLQLLELGDILFRRINYQYDVHWMEGGTLLHVYRLLHGQPIYPELTRSAGFLPNVYPPVLYFALAGVSAIFGLDYATGRVFSIVATTAGALLLAREVYLRFRGMPLPLVPAFLTLGAIAAGFPATGGWYDATMTDPLALTLAIVGGRLVLEDATRPNAPRMLLAALVMVLTIYTKQSYAVLVTWQVLFLSLTSLRRGVCLGLLTLVISALCLVLGQYLTHGTFIHYVGTQLFFHQRDPSRIWEGAWIVVRFAPYLPFVIAASVLLAFKRALSRPTLCWTGMLLFASPMALVHYAKIGGWQNNFMPIIMLAPAAGFCVLGDLCRLLRPRAANAALTVCALSAGAYLIARRYTPEPYSARKYRRAAAVQLNEYVASLGEEVLIPGRPFLAIRAGSRVEQVQVMSWFDALLAGRELSFDDFMRRTRPRYVILSDQEPAPMLEAMARDYYTIGRVPQKTWLAQTLEATFGFNRDPNAPVFPGQLHWVLQRSLPDPPGSRCLFEFESKGYAGFAREGQAFADGPPRIDAQRGTMLFASQGTVVGIVGDAYASSFSTKERDAATGRLESDPFVIDRKLLRLRIGGSAWPATRVELRIDGVVRHRASGTGTNLLTQVEWDVSAERGQSARFVVVDDDVKGHVLVDHVCLVDPVPAPP